MDWTKVVDVIQDHPSIHPHTGLPPYPSIDTPIYLSTCPSTIHPPTHIYLPMNPTHPSIIPLLTNLPTHPNIYSPTYISIYSSTYLPLGLPHPPVHQPTHPLIHHPCNYINIFSVTIDCVTGLFKAPLEIK